jgi:hypothetical protein
MQALLMTCIRPTGLTNLRAHKPLVRPAVQCWKQLRSAKAVAAADASSGFLAWAALGRMARQDGTVDEAADPMVSSIAS